MRATTTKNPSGSAASHQAGSRAHGTLTAATGTTHIDAAAATSTRRLADEVTVASSSITATSATATNGAPRRRAPGSLSGRGVMAPRTLTGSSRWFTGPRPRHGHRDARDRGSGTFPVHGGATPTSTV